MHPQCGPGLRARSGIRSCRPHQQPAAPPSWAGPRPPRGGGTGRCQSCPQPPGGRARWRFPVQPSGRRAGSPPPPLLLVGPGGGIQSFWRLLQESCPPPPPGKTQPSPRLRPPSGAPEAFQVPTQGHSPPAAAGTESPEGPTRRALHGDVPRGDRAGGSPAARPGQATADAGPGDFVGVSAPRVETAAPAAGLCADGEPPTPPRRALARPQSGPPAPAARGASPGGCALGTHSSRRPRRVPVSPAPTCPPEQPHPPGAQLVSGPQPAGRPPPAPGRSPGRGAVRSLVAQGGPLPPRAADAGCSGRSPVCTRPRARAPPGTHTDGEGHGRVSEDPVPRGRRTESRGLL